ncbi:MAG: FtsW/RodA/SpoVE family cell cycle protein, partial [Butyrivibrio sp.]|nr:FtsW/RodA/SpoVE family cell cycle protein [Butyrivibrio sp.]
MATSALRKERPAPYEPEQPRVQASAAGVRRQTPGQETVPRKGLLTAGYMDYSLVLIVFFLAIFGLIMLFSTSSFEAELKFGTPAYYVKRQLAASVFGVFVMLFLSYFPDYHVLEKLAVPAYVFSAGLIALVMTPLGYEANGARRWLEIKGVSIQPAEVAKLAMIVFLATLSCVMRDKLNTRKGVLVFM